MNRYVAVILGVLIALAVGAGYVAYEFHHYWSVTVPKADAAEWAGGMIVRHLKRTNGQWPRSWEDLRDDYEAGVAQVGRTWMFEDLVNRIVVDWDADPLQLAKAKPNDQEPPFHVVRARDGKDANWGGFEPNEMIFDYLRKHPPTTQPSDAK